MIVHGQHRSPRVLIFSGYGLNCESETKTAFERAGAQVDIIYLNDLIDGHTRLSDYQIAAFPGGFSYGDDTGSGNAYANRIRNRLMDNVLEFVRGDKLILGVCNGFQILVNLGLLPAFDENYGERSVALMHNDNARYMDRWVDVVFSGTSPWVREIGTISLPIAHGEGKFFAPLDVMRHIKEQGLIAGTYVAGQVCAYQHLPANPNGSLENIAALTDVSGRVLGMMPHPERAMMFTQLPYWPQEKEKLRRAEQSLPQEGPGMKLFRNGVAYFE